MTEYRMHSTKKTLCPHCGYFLDRATGTPGVTQDPESAPDPGDFSICIACCGTLVFTEELDVRFPTEEEQALMDEHPAFQRIVALAKVVSAKRRERKANEPTPPPN